MFERRNIQRTYLKISREVKDFLLSDKSREFFIFLFFFFVAGGFWLLQTLNNDYEADFSIPVRLKGVPNNVVITSEPASELRIKVKDKGTVLLNYMLGKSFYPVILDYADYKGVDNQVRIYPSQFEKKVLNQLNASTRLLSMKPDTLEYILSLIHIYVTSHFLYPLVVAVSVITTFLTPYTVSYTHLMNCNLWAKLLRRRICPGFISLLPDLPGTVSALHPLCMAPVSYTHLEAI